MADPAANLTLEQERTLAKARARRRKAEADVGENENDNEGILANTQDDDIEIEGPDGNVYAFPANTPRDVMRDAMRRRFGFKEPEAQEAARAPAQEAPASLDTAAARLGFVKTRLGWHQPQGQFPNEFQDDAGMQAILAQAPALQAQNDAAASRGESMGQADIAASAKAANDPSFVSQALQSYGDGAVSGLANMRAEPRSALETGARTAINSFGAAIPRAVSSWLSSGDDVSFGNELAIQNATDDRAGQLSPRAALIGEIAGGVGQVMTLPKSFIQTPIRAALTGGTLSGTKAFVDSDLDPGAALKAAATGAALGGVGAKAIAKGPVAAPTIAELKQSAGQGFDKLRDMGVAFKPQANAELLDNINARLAKEGFDPRIHKQTASLVRSMTKREGDVTLEQLRADRQLLADIGQPLSQEARVAAKVRREIDRFIDDASPNKMTGQAPEEAASLLRDANADYSAAMRAGDIQEALRKSASKAKSDGGSAGAKARSKLNSLANSDKKMRGFTPEERAMVEKVSHGSPTSNLARMLANNLSAGTLTGKLATAGTYASGGGLLSAALPAIGAGSQKAFESLTRRQVKDLVEALASRSALGRKMAEEAGSSTDAARNALLRALLGSAAVSGSYQTGGGF